MWRQRRRRQMFQLQCLRTRDPASIVGPEILVQQPKILKICRKNVRSVNNALYTGKKEKEKNRTLLEIVFVKNTCSYHNPGHYPSSCYSFEKKIMLLKRLCLRSREITSIVLPFT
jgi:hypothetical protein